MQIFSISSKLSEIGLRSNDKPVMSRMVSDIVHANFLLILGKSFDKLVLMCLFLLWYSVVITLLTKLNGMGTPGELQMYGLRKGVSLTTPTSTSGCGIKAPPEIKFPNFYTTIPIIKPLKNLRKKLSN